jgi:hypothetical protein
MEDLTPEQKKAIAALHEKYGSETVRRAMWLARVRMGLQVLESGALNSEERAVASLRSSFALARLLDLLTPDDGTCQRMIACAEQIDVLADLWTADELEKAGLPPMPPMK